jgi:CRISPR-associated protein Csb2
MFAVEVEYLLGRAVATDSTQRDQAEWPPHPTRLFSAFVDALSDISEDTIRECGEAALRWMEREPPPEIAAALDASHRTVVKHFVPINDDVVDAKNVRATPLVELRTRQERFFPAVVPADPRVVFAWPMSEPSEAHAEALAHLATRIPYLGHSSSLVRVSCRREAPPPTIAPALAGEYLLRVPGSGRLDRLNSIHALRKTDTYAQPPRGKEVPYAQVGGKAPAHGPFGGMRVFAFEGARFGLDETAWVTQRFRAALLSKLPSGDATPEMLSGHRPDGAPSTRPHLAFVPLANVWPAAGKFSDGGIKGMAVLVPRDLDAPSMMLLDTALSRIERLVFGGRGEVRVRAYDRDEAIEHPPREERRSGLRSLDTARYAQASPTWASVTPIALGLHAKPAKGLTEEEIVARHVRDLISREPTAIALHNVSKLYGAPPARTFLRGGIAALAGRDLRHAVIRFGEPVAGPLVVGVGRHMGFGLLLPWGNTK